MRLLRCAMIEGFVELRSLAKQHVVFLTNETDVFDFLTHKWPPPPHSPHAAVFNCVVLGVATDSLWRGL